MSQTAKPTAIRLGTAMAVSNTDHKASDTVPIGLHSAAVKADMTSAAASTASGSAQKRRAAALPPLAVTRKISLRRNSPRNAAKATVVESAIPAAEAPTDSRHELPAAKRDATKLEPVRQTNAPSTAAVASTGGKCNGSTRAAKVQVMAASAATSPAASDHQRSQFPR